MPSWANALDEKPGTDIIMLVTLDPQTQKYLPPSTPVFICFL
jgi:hypothetical protein